MTKIEIDLPQALAEQLAAIEQKLDALLSSQGQEIIGTAEAATILRCTEDTVRKYAREGLLAFTRPGGKNMAFRRQDVTGLVDQQSRRRVPRNRSSTS